MNTLPRESDQWFAEHIEKLRHDKYWMELPDIDDASTPDETVFFDDLSDKDQFNDRYIESRVAQGGKVSATKLFSGILFLSLVVIILDFFEKGVYFNGGLFSVAVISSLFVLGCFKYGHPTPIRFNRKAQLVHIVLVPSFKVISIPWRDVKPFIMFQAGMAGSYNLELLFPYRDPKGRNKTRDFPLRVSGEFDGADSVAACAAVDRWEFIRLYMEKGLDAIPVHEEARKEGGLTKPSGKPRKDDPDFNKDPISYIWRVWLHRILVFPWLVDHIFDKREANFRWPEEVEKLCEEGADLSGIDTRVVPARTDRYYYITPEGAPLFGTREYLRDYRIAQLRSIGRDPNGNPIPGFAEEQRKLAEQQQAAMEAQREAERAGLAHERAARRGGDSHAESGKKNRCGASWTPPKR